MSFLIKKYGLILISLIFLSCSNVSKTDIYGAYGNPDEWYFKFDTTVNLKKYWPNSSIPESLSELLNNSSDWNGMVYCQKSTGDIGVGLWRSVGKTNWGSEEIEIYWQNSGLMNLSFYRNGDWYFKKDFGKMYFTAGKESFRTKSTTWEKIKNK